MWGEDMDDRKTLLLLSAARLYSLGLDVEAARERLRLLVEDGVPYDSREMLEAYEAFTELDKQWKGLEQQHLELKEELRREREGASEE